MNRYFVTLARYNEWANRHLYDAAAQLPEPEYMLPRPAFFGSIHATLSHILVADRIWLARIEEKPNPPYRLDQILAYANTRGEKQHTQLRLVLGHFFNHQTHHRGQAHALLSHAGIAPPPLDLIFYLREPAAASD
jgi:uncharacterized damage-inducible protein DinB